MATPKETALDLSQRLLEAAKRWRPTILPNEICTLPVEEAREIAERYLLEQKFAPAGDNHHNARMCPYCNGGKVTVLLDRQTATKFINPDSPWEIADERKVINAVKEGLGIQSSSS